MSTAEQQRRIRMLRVVTVVLLLTGCQGCVVRHSCVHDPPLARNVHRIVRGQTTRAQILQYFGIPDLEAHGSKVTLRDDSVMGKQRQEMKQALEHVKMVAEGYGINSGSGMAGGTNLFDEMDRLWTYSSIDEDHVAYLYWEESYRGQAAIVPIPLPYISSLTLTGVENRTRQNKLLVLINKHTGVVDEFGYRQEFNAR